jgi:hypothetical protein
VLLEDNDVVDPCQASINGVQGDAADELVVSVGVRLVVVHVGLEPRSARSRLTVVVHALADGLVVRVGLVALRRLALSGALRFPLVGAAFAAAVGAAFFGFLASFFVACTSRWTAFFAIWSIQCFRKLCGKTRKTLRAP